MSSKKSTTTSNSTQTSTPNVPDWIQNPTMQEAGNVQNLINQGASAFTPTTSATQNQAFTNAQNLTTSPYYSQAATAYNSLTPYTASNVSADQVKGQSLLDNLSAYYNPYKDQVLNSTLADYDAQSGQTQAQQAAQAALNSAFRGSRYGVQEAQTTSDLARGRATTESGLLSDMYNSATALSGQDADRRQSAAVSNQSANLQAAIANQQAAEQAAALNQQGLLSQASGLAGLGASQGADTRANVSLQGDLGAQQTAQQNTIAQYPLTYQAQMESLLSGLNPSLYTGATTTGSSTGTTTQNAGLLGSLGQIASGASLFVNPVSISDRRAKVDIRTLFRDWKGRRWVEFAYRWAPAVRHVGVIAQELLKTDPEAVVRRHDGYLAVDYGGLA